MKCAIFEEHSSSCVVYSRFSGTLFPVSMIDGEHDIFFFFFFLGGGGNMSLDPDP